MTHAEALEIAIGAIVAGSEGRLTESRARQPGTTTYAICNIGAELGVEVSWQDDERHDAQFLDTAQGEDLSEWGADRYKMPREGATAAVVVLSLARVDTVGAVDVPVGTLVSTPLGIQFRTDVLVEFADTVAGPLTVEATSDQLGRDQNVAAAAIDRFVSAPPAATMTVTNVEEAAGGNDPELDDHYRSRLRDAFTTIGKGTRAAVRQGALQVDVVREAAAYEPTTVEGRAFGEGAIAIADEQGGSNQTMIDNVVEELEDWRALGVYVDVFGATVRLEAIALAVTYEPGFATPATKRAVQAAVVAVVNTLRPNAAANAEQATADSILNHQLVATAAAAVPGVIAGAGITVTLPIGTIAPDRGEVIRTNASLVTVS